MHTNIACYSVDTNKAVTLNEIDMAWYKCDDRGNFVAKFNMDEVEDYLDSELAKSSGVISVDMTLKGTTKETTTTEGVTFEGTDQVLVMMTTCQKNATTSFPMGR